ncbi:MAG TPA: YwqG family protein [Prevotella sp.]
MKKVGIFVLLFLVSAVLTAVCTVCMQAVAALPNRHALLVLVFITYAFCLFHGLYRLWVHRKNRRFEPVATAPSGAFFYAFPKTEWAFLRLVFFNPKDAHFRTSVMPALLMSAVVAEGWMAFEGLLFVWLMVKGFVLISLVYYYRSSSYGDCHNKVSYNGFSMVVPQKSEDKVLDEWKREGWYLHALNVPWQKVQSVQCFKSYVKVVSKEHNFYVVDGGDERLRTLISYYMSAPEKAVDDVITYDEAEELVNGMKRQGVMLAFTEADVVPCRSKWGGQPDLPEGMERPAMGGKPLSLLCQLRCVDLPEVARKKGLPACGMLYFFVDAATLATGDREDYMKGFKVIYTAEEASAGSSTPASAEAERLLPIVERPLVFDTLWDVPSEDEFVDSLLRPVGNDSHYTCRTALNEFYADIELPTYQGKMFGYADFADEPSYAFDLELANNWDEWELLLEVDLDTVMKPDADLSHEWSNSPFSTLYFFIPRDDLQRCDFSRVRIDFQEY